MSEEFYYVVIDKNDKSKAIHNACHMELRSDLVMFWDDRGGQIACIHDWKDVHKVMFIEHKLISNCTPPKGKKYGYDCTFNLKDWNLTIKLNSSGDVGELSHVLRNYVDRHGSNSVGKDIVALTKYLTECHKRRLA